MKCLSDKGLKKLIVFLESRIPGISKVIQIDGNKLSIDNNIKLYAFVEEPVTEAIETVMPDNQPMTPESVLQTPEAKTSVSQANQQADQTEKLEKLKIAKEKRDLENRLGEIEDKQDVTTAELRRLKGTEKPVTVNAPMSPKIANQENMRDKEEKKLLAQLAQAVGKNGPFGGQIGKTPSI